jgi:photosystem II stability/assembly factor-like uncharacterized protein
MKKIFIMIIFISIIYFDSRSDFHTYFDMDLVTADYMSMCLANENDIYLCGLYGTIHYSSDRGQSWSICKSNTDELLFSIDAEGNNAISVGTGGTIRYTYNKGLTWKAPDSITSVTLKSVVMIDEQTGVAFGYSGTILKTTNGGENWLKINTGTNDNFYCSAITETNTLLTATYEGNIYKSVNNGENWEKLDLDINFTNPYNFSYTFNKIIYLLTEDNLLKSTDNGISWIELPKPYENSNYCCYINNDKGFILSDYLKLKFLTVNEDTSIIDTINLVEKYDEDFPVPIKSLKFFDENNGIAIGLDNLIAITSDGGMSWKLKSFLCLYNSFPQSTIGSVYFINDSNGFIGTGKENLYKTTNYGKTWEYIEKCSNRGSHYEINNLFFYDEYVGMMMSQSYSGTLLRTYDGGKTVVRDTVSNDFGPHPRFQTIDIEDSLFLFYSLFLDNSISYYYYGSRYFSGQWDYKSKLDSSQIFSKHIFNKNRFIFAGTKIDSSLLPEKPNIYYSSLISVTSDGGKSWSKYSLDSIEVVRSMIFENDNIGYIFGNQYKDYSSWENIKIYKTTDGGSIWNLIDTNYIRVSSRLKNNKNYCVAFDNENNFIFSPDNGVNWHDIQVNKNFYIRSIFATNNCFYIKCSVGDIWNVLLRLKLKDEFINVTEEEIESPVTPLAFILEPYPNPARNYTNFFIVWKENYAFDDLKISVYDINGEKITNPKLDFNAKTVNTGILTWYPSGIATGVYFIEVEVGGYKRARKVMIY